MRLLSLFISVMIFSPLTWAQNFTPLTFAPAGEEHKVQFTAEFESKVRDLQIVESWSPGQKESFARSIKPTFKYLFGPLTHRNLGGIKEHLDIEVHWDKAYVKNRRVYFPYTYTGLWLMRLDLSMAGGFKLPVPLNLERLKSKNWLQCTDSDPEHQTESFYWYFWDPSRYGCDHKEGEDYKMIFVSAQEKTQETLMSYPEYSRMIRQENGGPKVTMTVAFGYAVDANPPRPETDTDVGAAQYRVFKGNLKQLLKSSFVEDLQITPITLEDYEMSGQLSVIGEKYSFSKNGLRFEIKVVINAEIDQMMLFAKSYAHDHDAYFAWLGHSRVGSGFDAWQFQSIIESEPSYYELSSEYQLVYWGGCNSYSYYTLPFFEQKAKLSPELDPKGTKNLDIIANTLPSLFLFNAQNALIQVRGILASHFTQTPVSYQQMLQQTEAYANQWGSTVLTVVLGDEDNQ